MTKTAKRKRRAVRIKAGIISLSLLSCEATALTLDRLDNDRLEEDSAIPNHALPSLQSIQDFDSGSVLLADLDLGHPPDPRLSLHENVISAADMQHAVCR